MTRQTARPLEHHNLRTSDRSPREIVTSFRLTFGLDLDPDYQRGDVWTDDQRVALIRSWLTGTPTGVVILNDRTTPEWKEANGYDPTDRGEAMYVCIDGKQRITTAYRWYDDELAVPATWFPQDDVTATEETDDGPYVRLSGLAKPARLKFANRAHLSVAMAKVATAAEEAEIYLLVNGGGTPQSEADMDNATRIAAASPRAER
ncbi:DUF262 domain-containing protein [Streptomyces sp. NBC_00239]|uniref:DUF262 domain-containing protein n=1 Tax=Streptomyces sp. NBC_00239 TaxID=2903640 RepID=UPI002E28185B|nr:DUF262 domain-containing protein [Streptomyces sp. NBC_00239]